MVTGLVLPVEGPVHQGRWQPRPGGGCGWQLRMVLPVCRRIGLQVDPCLAARLALLRLACCQQTQAHMPTACECGMLNTRIRTWLTDVVQSHSVGASAIVQRLLQVWHRCQRLPATHHGERLTETQAYALHHRQSAWTWHLDGTGAHACGQDSVPCSASRSAVHDAAAAAAAAHCALVGKRTPAAHRKCCVLRAIPQKR
jgi:hypothetical protein